MNAYDGWKDLDLADLLELIGKNSSGSIQGLDQIRLLENLVTVRTTEAFSRQLVATAGAIGASASEIRNTLTHSAAAAKSALEENSRLLIAALKVNTEIGSKNAEEIKDEISALATNLARASTDLQTASTQSSRLSARLNWLTGALFVAAILTAGATVFQGIETKRQADLVEKQLQSQNSSTSTSRRPPEVGRDGRRTTRTPNHKQSPRGSTPDRFAWLPVIPASARIGIVDRAPPPSRVSESARLPNPQEP